MIKRRKKRSDRNPMFDLYFEQIAKIGKLFKVMKKIDEPVADLAAWSEEVHGGL